MSVDEPGAQSAQQAAEAYAKATLNILDDFAEEKAGQEDIQRATLNILDDFAEEKAGQETIQRAMLNLLEDFDIERVRAETRNVELVEALDSLRRAKDAQDAANRELEAFSYSVSHDLRAPLRSIDGFSLALLEDFHDRLDAEGRDHLRRVRAATQRMSQLIDDLLRLSRLTRGQLNIMRVDLSTMALKAFQGLQETHPEREVSFVAAPAVDALGDQELLKVVLENLIGNAWKFTSKTEDPQIEFGSTFTDGERAYFVKDNGAGFDMSYSDKLFATFQRLHRDDEFPGTGIGLSLVQRVVHRLGGRVWGEGAVGQGAIFYFTLNP
jgi:light-regulated signal transduction histidine kinase (bacteriophytochrome)